MVSGEGRSLSTMSEAKLKFSKDVSGRSRIVDTSMSVIKLDENQSMSIAPRSGAVTSIHIPTTMGGKRRVHTEGLKMLDEQYSLKEEKIKMQSMENRI